MPDSPDPQASAPDDDPLATLAPSARRAPVRTRVAVGAAVVCFVAAVAVAAVLSATAGGGGEQGVIGAATAPADVTTDARPGGSTAAPTGEAPALLVHVLGGVARPGLVELAAGARVVDAIAAAGGLTPEADPAGVNLARPVADGEQLLVPLVGQEPVAPAGGAGGVAGAGAAGGAAGDGLVHLNTAGLAELDTLPRIGPALAQRILDWREANGGFSSVDQLREVAGIGDATFAGLVDLVAL
ncbi:ComEA family DNA-binding protein [Agromyces sp. G08B096]|uniref:ComEA family DNA-binding protein n=1 Tax=Agromyces sp. G08B096 TaxID=3156399 RepID=A0AAU7W4A8_9MICO